MVDIKDSKYINPLYTIPLFEIEKPFQKKITAKSPMFKILTYSKVYEYRSLEIKKIAQRYLEYKGSKNYELALKSLKFK